MTQKLLDAIGQAFPLTQKDVAPFQTLKANGMGFQIRAWEARGLGHVSCMTASGFFGLMKMDTLIITPTRRDMPLFSYDRVHAMGNDTLIVELYDTFLENQALDALEQVKSDHAALPDHDLGSHWYDSIKLPQSLAKKGKQHFTVPFDVLTTQYLNAYLTLCAGAPECDPDAKREKAAVYVEGLLSHGGPSTDVFKKALGGDITARIFRSVLFGTRE